MKSIQLNTHLFVANETLLAISVNEDEFRYLFIPFDDQKVSDYTKTLRLFLSPLLFWY